MAQKRGCLRWQRIEDAKQSEFFRWFSFAEAGATKEESGRTVLTFRPEGEKFRRLVKLDAVLDEKDFITALRLTITRLFVDHNRDGIFARDITKSFLRSAFPEPDDTSVATFAAEIEGRHNFPVITRAFTQGVPLPVVPTTGFLTYIGQQQLYEETYAQSSLRIEQVKDDDGEAVVITV